MSFVISTKEMSSGEKYGEVYVKGNYCRYKRNLLVFKGETHNYYDKEELFDYIIQEGIGIVEKLKGDFFIIYYDNNLRKMYIANDKLGRETIFYFNNHNNFILSDDFWEIVNLVGPNISDIEIQSIKEFVVFLNPMFYKTIIKDLNFFPPASIGEYLLKEHIFKIRHYWDFKYKPNENLKLDEVVDRLDSLFDNGIKQIKERNGPKVSYGIGLSGGLDSRLIPHYVLRHGMDLKSFIIGEKRPHKFVLSRDHKSARMLAEYYNLDHYEIEYNSETFENKSFYDIRYYPMGPSNLFTCVQNKLPKFDILLTGISGGELLGSTLPSNIIELSGEELLDTIIETFSHLHIFKNRNLIIKLINKLPKYLKSIFKYNYLTEHLDKRQSIDGIINRNEVIEAKSKIRQFIKDNSDKNNVDIWQKYLFFHRAFRNKYGAFGSLYGQFKSYSIFVNSNVLEETLTWKLEYLINRRLQNYFYITKFPELAKIPAQHGKVSILYRNNSSKFRKALALIAFIIRRTGLRYVSWAWKEKYRKYSFKILLRENQIFNKIFDVNKIIKLGKEDMRMYENVVKIKQILDLIETKDYKDFFRHHDGSKKVQP